MRKDLDPSEQGGAPILGISKPVIKAHGSSDAKAFKNAIRQAASFAQSGAVDEISRAMLSYEEKRRAAKAVQNSAE
jgi:glycerol-3-phosphate acyltransferase PlsX